MISWRPVAQLFLRALQHLHHHLAACATIDRDHALFLRIPAEERDGQAHQFALQDVDRVLQPGQQCVGVPEGLVLRRQDVAAVRQVLQALDLEGGPDDLPASASGSERAQFLGIA